MAKFELTYKQYMDSVICTLSSKLSIKCAITITKNEFGYGGLKTIMKEYPEFDSLRLEWEDWHYTFDTKVIEKSYNEERSINEFSDMLINQIKTEFVKQILREEKE